MALRQMEPKEVVVGNRTYYITPFPALKAANISGELTSTVAPLLSVVAPFVKSLDKDSLYDLDVRELATAIAGVQSIDGDKLEKMIFTLLVKHNNVSFISDNGNPCRMTLDLCNEIFCCDLIEMFMLCIEVVRLNFGDFFSKVTSLFGVQKDEEAQITKFPGTESSTTQDSMN